MKNLSNEKLTLYEMGPMLGAIATWFDPAQIDLLGSMMFISAHGGAGGSKGADGGVPYQYYRTFDEEGMGRDQIEEFAKKLSAASGDLFDDGILKGANVLMHMGEGVEESLAYAGR